MSVSKLLGRIVAPTASIEERSEHGSKHSRQSAAEKDVDEFVSSFAHDAIGGYLQDHKANTIKKKKKLHDHTYGITSDPLTQFACVFSALIHDVDHAGVPNAQLINEQPALASAYKHKSVAEQASI